MACPKCSSSNVSIQVVNESILKNKHHNFFWWLIVGWWFVPAMWFLFFVPKLFIKLFGLGHKKQKIVNVQKKVSVCQTCGNTWSI
jgi:cellulose synthase/poly-beta-1,6-N-acetylglucosamine synthase-like glycosyltransferase